MTDLWEDKDEGIRRKKKKKKSARALQYPSFSRHPQWKNPRNSTFEEGSAVPFKEVSKLQEACYTVGTTGDVLKGPKRIVKSGREKIFPPQLKGCSGRAGSDRKVITWSMEKQEGHLSMRVGLSFLPSVPLRAPHSSLT